MFSAKKWARAHLNLLSSYQTVRDAYEGRLDVLLDANENAYALSGLENFQRYPDPKQRRLKQTVAELNGWKPEGVFVGNGSDEIIDLLIRTFCEPEREAILVAPPTFSVYEIFALNNHVGVVSVPQNEGFEIDAQAVLAAVSPKVKIIFICSPNNPTGNAQSAATIRTIIEAFDGLVVLDEAYIDFQPNGSFLPHLGEYPNLIILQTFSKAYSLAGLRVGLAFASPEIIHYLDMIRAPYNVNQASSERVLQALEQGAEKETYIRQILIEKEKLKTELLKLPCVVSVFPSDANFWLTQVTDGAKVFDHLLEKGILVRALKSAGLPPNCLRITVGTPDENRKLIAALQSYTS